MQPGDGVHLAAKPLIPSALVLPCSTQRIVLQTDSFEATAIVRADYDSEAKTIQIDLEAFEGLDYGDDEVDDRVVVGIRKGKPVRIDLLEAKGGLEEPLRKAADVYELDADALIAAARAALSVPDRTVVLDVGVRAAA